MTEAARLFTGQVPEIYDRFLGPAVFEPMTEPVAERVARLAPDRILEIAAGTGLLTECLANVLPDAVIIATDLNEAMIDYGARSRHAPGVVWEAADAARLPYADDAFDAVVCQFGAMFFPDRPASFAESRRVLAEDGALVLAIWDALSTHDFERIVDDTVRALIGRDEPTFLAKVPHGYADPDRIRADLLAGGFHDVEVETATTISVAHADDVAIGYVQGTPLRGEIEAHVAGGFERAVQAVQDALLVQLGTGQTNEISGRLTAHVVTAR